MKKPGWKKIILLTVGVILYIGIVTAAAALSNVYRTIPRDVDLEEDAKYFADITIEDYGTITIELDHISEPWIVSNFIENAEHGFYDETRVYRVIEDFMLQSGIYYGDESYIRDIPADTKASSALNKRKITKHTRGVLSTLRLPEYEYQEGDQYFIVQQDSPHLDGVCKVFGYVKSGMEIIDEICNAAKPIDEKGTVSVDAQPVISSVEIRVDITYPPELEAFMETEFYTMISASDVITEKGIRNVKASLYALKKVYPQKEYRELYEMRSSIEEGEEWFELLEGKYDK